MDSNDCEFYNEDDLSLNYFDKDLCPINSDLTTNSTRSSSFDIEECLNHMNSISNVDPRFAVEIDLLTFDY
ncbi:hypothetical protein SteCoe_4073 [Stentor coeruleus]|uniref:Uncharacterized protein n=1 Tax=Stentor coeruleus TaxID=5963 RepID=A0A1R2CVJ0_9CILI|nr:hypothetical protein SteCoe_4073 [Stentor coeruleus]